MDSASVNALCRLQVVEIGLRTELGREDERCVENEKMEQRATEWKEPHQGSEGNLLPMLTCLVGQGAG